MWLGLTFKGLGGDERCVVRDWEEMRGAVGDGADVRLPQLPQRREEEEDDE